MQKFRAKFHFPILPLLAMALALTPLACGSDDDSREIWTDISRSNSSSGSTDQVFLVDTSGNVNLTYTLELGVSPMDVYFIFTNTTMSDAGSNPVVKNMESDEPQPEQLIMSDNSETASIVETGDKDSTLPAQRGTPEISEFNRLPFSQMPESSINYSLKSLITAPIPMFYTIGNTIPFYYDSSTTTFDSRCSFIKTAHGKTLNVWIEKRISSAGTNDITDSDAQTIGLKFLNDNTTSDDIYEWISNIFGAEWGSHSYDELITANSEIHILIYEFAHYDASMANVIGFFWAKDNFKSMYYGNSNQKIMFYLNSSFVNSSIDDIYSTLAHEFQHMINFYQKNVLRTADGSGSETWINEMCSMVAEDLVSRKLQVNGPRGVNYNLASAGLPYNTEGRLPRYNYYNYISLVKWLTTYPSVLNSYSINYAFGAYLARNFGGAPFFQKIIQNQYTDYQAINYALIQAGYTEDFTSTLRKWAAANLLSDNYSPPAGYFQYNKNDWFSSTIGTISYDLGSINLYNYSYGGQTEPRYFTSSVPYGKDAASNVFFRVGTNLTGTVSRSVTMEDNIKLTVVLKQP